MIDIQQVDWWEELEQLRQSCAAVAIEEQDAEAAAVNGPPTAKEIVLLAIFCLLVLLMAWAVWTYPGPYWDIMKNLICPPGTTNFGC
jgi:ferric-dicitrate binding protein FerR (iron transport regulator)